MGDGESDITRRSVLQTSGAAILASGALASTGAARGDLVDVDPVAVELDDCDDAGAVAVEIDGPPFGRTDVEVAADGVTADPRSFELEGRGDSETVAVGSGDGTVVVTATTPRGDEQTETIDVTCGDPEFDVTVENADPIERWSITGAPDPQTIEVTVENVGDGPGEQVLGIVVVPDEQWMETWEHRGGDERSVALDAGESTSLEFELEWVHATNPDERYGWDVIVESDDDADDVRIEMIGM